MTKETNMSDKQFSLDEMQAEIDAVFSSYTKSVIDACRQFCSKAKELDAIADSYDPSKYKAFRDMVKAREEQHMKELDEAVAEAVADLT
jgi:hypothetical protein